MRRFAATAGFLTISSAALAAEETKGMPQLDFANPLTIAQVVWLAIIFAALYLLLSRWALPEVAEVLEMRAATIGADLEAARTAKAQADEAVAELTTATRAAQAGAQSQINTAVDAAKAEAAARSAELNAKLEAQLAEAEQRIGAARAAAVGALRSVATETATLVVQRLSGLAPDTQAIDAAVGDVLAARGHA